MLPLATFAMIAAAPLASGAQPGRATTACDACVLVAQAPLPTADAMQRAELQLQIDDLAQRSRGVNVQWPGLAVVALYVGVSLAPNLIAWAIFKYAFTLPMNVFQVLGPTLLITGIVGASCLVGGLLLGITWSAVQRSRRDDLVHQREALEAELKTLSSGPEPQPAAWLARLHF
jgi:hypothetical protein